MEANKKLEDLKNILLEIGSAVVAFSGGVDSAFLLKVAGDVLKDKALAVIGRSNSYPEREFKDSTKIAEKFGVEYLTIDTKEIDDENYSSNPINRCYYCKSELFIKLQKIAKDRGFTCVVEGSNADDVHDFRPGMEAACDFGVRSPLKESGLTKNEIRSLSKDMGLPTWDKPSAPCLSSRFPYGTQITKNNLEMVDKSEQFLFDLGLKQFRVRYHGNLARIEVLKKDMEFILKDDITKKILSRFKEIGFVYISMDIQGYRMGSMNEILSASK